jgi:hypothetical protein
MKICNICRNAKQESDFSHHCARCKTCDKEVRQKNNKKRASIIKEQKRLYYLNKKEHIHAAHKKYYALNKEKTNKRSQKNYFKNKKHVLKRHKAYRENNKARYKVWCKKWYVDHKEECLKQGKEYRKNHKDERNKYIRAYCKRKRKTDIHFRLSGLLRSRLYCALKGICKSASAIKLIGCEIDFLKSYQKSERKNPELILGMRVARRRPRR